jgi:hypothetical protein
VVLRQAERQEQARRRVLQQRQAVSEAALGLGQVVE